MRRLAVLSLLLLASAIAAAPADRPTLFPSVVDIEKHPDGVSDRDIHDAFDRAILKPGYGECRWSTIPANPTSAALGGITVAGIDAKFRQAMQDVAPAPKPKEMYIQTPDGEKFRVVDREKMRVHGGKKFSVSAPGAKEALKDVKPAPATFSYGTMKDGTPIKFPVLGNNRWGDCFYVAPAHLTQSVVGMRKGIQTDFDEAKLVARYKVLSHGDNGLSDDDILPEWKTGIVGPKGPYKILDWATIDPADTASVKTALYYMGGLVTTHCLRTTWMSNIRNGMVWTNDGRIDRSAGHAVHLYSVNTSGNFGVTTWGLQVEMTPAGLANSEAEVIVPVPVDWFDSRGYTPNGTHYTEIAKVWEIGTGRKLPQGVFPDPGPEPTPTPPVPPTPVPPSPPAPSSGSVVVDPSTRTVTIPDGWTVRGGGVNPVPAPPGVTSPAVEFVKNHAAKKQARKDGAGLIVSKSELAAARAKIDAAVSDADVETMLREKGAKIAGPLTDLLDWVTSHTAELEALINLILKLVALFAVDLPAEPPAWREVSWVLAV